MLVFQMRNVDKTSTVLKQTNIVLKKSFYGCSNYPECKFTL